MLNFEIIEPYAFTASGNGSGEEYVGNARHGQKYVRSASSGYIQFDLGEPRQVDRIAILNSNMTPGGSWQVRADDDAAVSNGPLYDSGSMTLSTEGTERVEGLYNYVWQHPTSAAVRYYRADFNANSSPIEFPFAIIGKAHSFTYNFDRGTVPIPQEAALEINGDYGDYDVISGRRWHDLQLGMVFKRDEMYNQVIQLFNRIGAGRPFLIRLQPENSAFDVSNMYYGFLPKTITPGQPQYTELNPLTLRVRGLI